MRKILYFEVFQNMCFKLGVLEQNTRLFKGEIFDVCHIITSILYEKSLELRYDKRQKFHLKSRSVP